MNIELMSYTRNKLRAALESLHDVAWMEKMKRRNSSGPEGLQWRRWGSRVCFVGRINDKDWQNNFLDILLVSLYFLKTNSKKALSIRPGLPKVVTVVSHPAFLRGHFFGIPGGEDRGFTLNRPHRSSSQPSFYDGFFTPDIKIAIPKRRWIIFQASIFRALC